MGVAFALEAVTFKDWVKAKEPAEKTERTVTEIGEDLESYVLESQEDKEKMGTGTENFRKVRLSLAN